MTVVTIRSIDDALAARLRVRAAMHGRSVEDEARDILRSALSTELPRPRSLGEAIHERFAALGGVDLAESLRARRSRSRDDRPRHQRHSGADARTGRAIVYGDGRFPAVIPGPPSPLGSGTRDPGTPKMPNLTLRCSWIPGSPPAPRNDGS